jgi:hypothetical protein
MSAHDAEMRRHVERWVEEDLISRSEAEAILRFEAGEAPAPHRISLATEAVGYVGAALLLAAGGVLLSRFWEGMDDLSHIAVLAVGTAALIGLGWVLHASSEPAIGRLAGVLWVAGTGTAAGLAATVVIDVANAHGRVPETVAGVTATAVAMPLYAIRRRALQHVALFAGAIVTAAAIFGDTVAQGLAMWAVAAAWTILARRSLPPPQRAGYALGSAGMLVGAMQMADASTAGLWLGLVTAVALLATSVLVHERVLLGFGAAGLFVFLLRTISEYLGGGAGMAVGLAAAWFVVLLVAVLLSRRTARREMQA